MTTITRIRNWAAAHRHIVAMGGLSLAHFVVCWGAFIFTYKDTMARFETGRLPNDFEASIQSLFDTLSFPFLMLAGYGPAPLFQTMYGFVPLLLTSMLWGTTMYVSYHGVRRSMELWKQHRPRRRVREFF